MRHGGIKFVRQLKMRLIHLIDILGTLAFAVSGAFRAVKYELDLLGVMVLAVATGVGGGIMRDLLLGSTPPTPLVDQTYILTCLLGAALVFLMAPKIAQRWDYVMAADAVGLSVFTAIGAAKAEECGAVPLTVVMMAMITASGGGMIRDLLVMEVPAVLKSDFYATAALIGGTCFVMLGRLGVGDGTRLACTIAVTLSLRALAMKYGMRLPRVKSLPVSPSRLTQQRKGGAPKPDDKDLSNKPDASDA
jgi:uncharacterized membrane protein YeiH